MKIKTITVIFFFAAVLSGCKTTADIRPAASPPQWVSKETKIEGMICAVGMSEPTFYKSDAKKYAADNARAELARSLSVEVKSIMIDIVSDNDSAVAEATVAQVSSWATSVALRNSEIRENWFDLEGTVSSKKNTAYALSCMPRRFDKRELERRLSRDYRPGSSGYERIHRTIDKVVDKLEAQR